MRSDSPLLITIGEESLILIFKKKQLRTMKKVKIICECVECALLYLGFDVMTSKFKNRKHSLTLLERVK